MDMALELKVPVVALIDSGGARIQEGVAALTQYGRIFRKTCEASGFIPQISIILGPCAGGAVYCPALTDLIIMTRENSSMFVTGPDVVKAATGETISMDDLGGGLVHNATSGVAHYLGEDEARRHRLRAHRAGLPAVQLGRQPADLRLRSHPRRFAPWPSASAQSCRRTTASPTTCST